MFSNLTKEQFDILKNRANEFVQAGGSPNDPLILPALEVINANPHLATVWSCQGHTTEEIIERDGDDVIYDHNYMEFIFAIENSEQGTEQLKKIAGKLGELTHGEWRLFRPSLSLIELLWCFGEDFDIDNDTSRYACWKMKLHYFGEFNKEHVSAYNSFAVELFSDVNNS